MESECIKESVRYCNCPKCNKKREISKNVVDLPICYCGSEDVIKPLLEQGKLTIRKLVASGKGCRMIEVV